MTSDSPYLELISPEGEEQTIWLKDILASQPDPNRITIGRHTDNAIVLPDPYKKISRSHCYLERKSGRWWLVDEGSQNGTFIQYPNGEYELDVRTDGIVPLKDSSIILILGKLQDSTQPVFWKITFRDPEVTEVVQKYEVESILEYNLTQEKLFRFDGKYREELKLRPKEKILIDYMAQKN